jgi:hypothetical protein
MLTVFIYIVMLKPPTLILLTLGASSLLYRSFFDPPENDSMDMKIYIGETLADVIALGVGMCGTEWLYEHIRPFSYIFLIPPFFVIATTLILILKLKMDDSKSRKNKKG